MDLASKIPAACPSCDARHDATEILYGHFARASRPLFAHGLRQRTPVGTGGAQICRSIDANSGRVR